MEKHNKVNPVNDVYEKFRDFKDRKYLKINIDDKEIYDIFNKCNAIYNCVYGNYEFSPLEIEIIMNNRKKVLELIEGTDLNNTSSQGYTPLEVAISMGNYDITKLLIEKGADVNLHSFYTPLNLAVASENYEIIKLLIESGANVNYLDQNGYNAQHYLLTDGNLRIRLVDPIFSKIGYRKTRKHTQKNICDIIDLLFQNGIDINCNGKCKIGLDDTEVFVNPLSLAVARMESNVIEKLISCGAKKEIIELDASWVYAYQDSFDFLEDILDGDISMWIDAPGEYLRFLKYKRNIVKNGIKVTVTDLNDGYKRHKILKKSEKN